MPLIIYPKGIRGRLDVSRQFHSQTGIYQLSDKYLLDKFKGTAYINHLSKSQQLI